MLSPFGGRETVVKMSKSKVSQAVTYVLAVLLALAFVAGMAKGLRNDQPMTFRHKEGSRSPLKVTGPIDSLAPSPIPTGIRRLNPLNDPDVNPFEEDHWSIWDD